MFNILSGNGLYVRDTLEGKIDVKSNVGRGCVGCGDAVVAATTALWNLLSIYENLMLDEWVIMPNHIHLIICFNGRLRSTISNKMCNLGDVIRSFKLHFQKQIVAATTVSPLSPRQAHATLFPKQDISSNYVNPYTFWQKGFYDHIIRNEGDLNRVREYILLNPQNWKVDEFNC